MKLDELNKESILKMDSIELEVFIEKNELSEKQQIELYKIYNAERKANVKNYIKKEGVKSIAEGVTYVHAFTQNLMKIGDNISGAEFKILFYFCHLMQHGNLLLINFNQKSLAEDTGMSQSNVSKSLKKLKEKGILIEDNGHTFINSNLFLKGQYHSLNKDRREYVKKAQGKNTIFDSVYNLKAVKKTKKEELEEREESLKDFNLSENLTPEQATDLFPDQVPF